MSPPEFELMYLGIVTVALQQLLTSPGTTFLGLGMRLEQVMRYSHILMVFS